ncbi:helicase [Tanacetum coccineum]
MAKEWCRSYGSQDFNLRLISKRTTSRQYNAPTVSEVVTLVVNDFGDGIPQYMMPGNYQDAMALCRAYGNPDLFITFTSNPKWVEIGKCGKHYLKVVLGWKTVINEDGYPSYHRRITKYLQERQDSLTITNCWSIKSVFVAEILDDLEEMDLKWQLALLSMRTRRFFWKTDETPLQGNADRDLGTSSRNRIKTTIEGLYNVGRENSSKAMVAIMELVFDSAILS